MTRKDYVAIAQTIKRHTILGSHVPGHDAEIHLAVVHCMARDIADVMMADSPTFDRARFLKACGVQS